VEISEVIQINLAKRGFFINGYKNQINVEFYDYGYDFVTLASRYFWNRMPYEPMT
jgi:hypothetical protein